MKHLSILIMLCTFLMAASPALPAETLRHVRIEDPNSKELAQQLERQGFDVLYGSITENHLEVIVSVAGLQDLRAAGHAPETLAVGRPFRDIQAERQADLSVPAGYPDFSEVISQLSATADSFPDICQLVDLTETYATPATVEGRHLYAVEDRTPRVYPWLNEPGGGMLVEWKSSSPHTASIAYSTMWYGCANTAAGS